MLTVLVATIKKSHSTQFVADFKDSSNLWLESACVRMCVCVCIENGCSDSSCYCMSEVLCEKTDM